MKTFFKNMTTNAANIPIGTARVIAAFCSTLEMMAKVVAKVVAVTGSAAILRQYLHFLKIRLPKRLPSKYPFSCPH